MVPADLLASVEARHWFQGISQATTGVRMRARIGNLRPCLVWLGRLLRQQLASERCDLCSRIVPFLPPKPLLQVLHFTFSRHRPTRPLDVAHHSAVDWRRAGVHGICASSARMKLKQSRQISCKFRPQTASVTPTKSKIVTIAHSIT